MRESYALKWPSGVKVTHGQERELQRIVAEAIIFFQICSMSSLISLPLALCCSVELRTYCLEEVEEFHTYPLEELEEFRTYRLVEVE